MVLLVDWVAFHKVLASNRADTMVLRIMTLLLIGTTSTSR